MTLDFKKCLLAGAAAALTLACHGPSEPLDDSADEALRTGANSPVARDANADAGSVFHGTFRERWEDGTTCGSTPKVEVWKHTASTVIFRQSPCTNFEAPFLYLLLGQTRALLLDTGTNHADVKTPVDAAINEWMASQGLASLPLVVAHTHSHGDHVKGDSQFRNRPNTTVVGLQPQQVATFFGLTQWPEGSSTFDLGGRVLDVVPLPGHESSHVAIYDRQSELLFTGDTLYPGRLYIQSWSAYRASTKRLVDFVAQRQLPVRWILGAHIEMSTTEGDDYPFQAMKHPNEHPMQQPYERLTELNRAVQAMGSTPRRETHAHFIIYP
jgi:glyoxylase-like metal-dependent hydrolase (beta-lactamase superfamily II)